MHFFDSRICKSFASGKFFVSKQKPGHQELPRTIAHFLHRDLRMGPGEGSPDEKSEAATKQKRPACAASARAPMPEYR
jgi:hypothetical protein